MEKQTAEGNRLIAELMGFRYEHNVHLGGSSSRFYKIGGTFDDSFPYAKYHSSWDWLMPVVEKIEAMGYAFNITYTTVSIMLNPYERIVYQVSDTKLEAIYQAILSFITFYNKNKQS